MGLLGFNSPNNLSQRAILVPKQDASGPGRAVSMIQLRDTDDGEAQNLNVVLIPAVDPLVQPKHGPCIAILEWGTGSASVAAEVDFAKGTQLQLSASYLSISGRNDGNLPDGAGGTVDPKPGLQTVIAMVSGYGSRVAFGRATRTFHRRALPRTEVMNVPVPNFAKSVLISGTPLGTAIAVEIFDSLLNNDTDPVPALRSRYEFASVAAPRIDLIDVAATVRVRNIGAATIDYLQVAFELCL